MFSANDTFDRYYFRLNSKFETTFHTHLEYEINYVYDGRCRIMVGDRSIDMALGSLLIMDGMTPHGSIMEETCTHTMLRFNAASIRSLLVLNPDVDLLQPFHNMRTHCWRLTEKNKEELEHILHQMENFCRYSDPIRLYRMQMVFLDLLLFICERSHETQIRQLEVPAHKETKVRELMQYINENYMCDLSMDILSREVHFSKFYLARLFKGLTGITVFEYVNRQRIIRAKLFLIEEKSTTVTEICFRVGFKDLAHFSKNFKLLVGVSPERYRKSQGVV